MSIDLKEGERAAVRVGIGDQNKNGKVDIAAEFVFHVPPFPLQHVNVPPVDVPIEEAAQATAKLTGAVAGFAAGAIGIKLPPLPSLPSFPKL